MSINYTVKEIEREVGRSFIIENHYSKCCHPMAICYGLFDREELLGVLAFANPIGELVRSNVFGKEYKDTVTELHRLFVMDGTPKNTESYFISRAIKLLQKAKPQLRAVVSFADSTEGHRGIIYQATNALYFGVAKRRVFYRDQNRVLRQPRQNGKYISIQEALERGWSLEQREVKHRYLFLLGDKKWGKKNLRLKLLPYPKERAQDAL